MTYIYGIIQQDEKNETESEISDTSISDCETKE